MLFFKKYFGEQEEKNMNKAILASMALVGGATAGALVTANKMNDIICDKQVEKEKFRIMYQLMEKWMRIKMAKKTLIPYFEIYDYKNIAIYGMGDIGKLLLDELDDSTISVKYGIDKNVTDLGKIQVVNPDDNLEKVDAIVVTAIAYFDEIEKMLSEKVNCPIISLEDIIYELV